MTGDSCVFCGGPFWRWQSVSGDRVGVCEFCASFGAAALQAGGLLDCLHAVACDIEREMRLRAKSFTSRQRKVMRRLVAALDRSEFVAACACPACAKVQVESDLGLGCFEGPPVNLFEIDGVPVFTDLDMGEIPLWVLRSMSDRVRVPDPDGVPVTPFAAVPLWKAFHKEETALGDDCANRLQALADGVKRPGGWISVGKAAERLAVRHAAQDAAASRHWSMVQRYGLGLRDGDFWLGRDGALIPLQEVDRVFPMTDADRRALEADKARAARWRADPS